jgi:thiamine pyrophosphate-dependent acetolactate synthase large subunit-like protein
MTLRDALARIVPHLRDEVCVHANGFLSRAAFGARDADTCFYMIGSMGLASSIGLGVALARPERRVIVFDGDGNVLMNLGTLATIATLAPPNLLHVCFDNGAHASTGGQATIADRVALEEVARTVGYRWAGRVDGPDALDAALPAFLAREGPAFLLVRIALGPPGPPGPRISWTPPEMTARLRRALGTRPAGAAD